MNAWPRVVAALIVTVTVTSPARAQQSVTLLAAAAERGVVLRWAWGEGERPTGWLVERRSNGGAWVRLTAQPVTRVRDRALARATLAARFARFEGLLFAEDPRAELADPESYRSLQLLAADVDPDVARLLGLRYDDLTAPVGERHEYRLIALTAGGARVAATSDVIEAGRYLPARGPDSLRAAQGRAGISLRWNPAAAFSAYHVYKGSRADGRDAVRLSSSPVVIFFDDDGARTQAAATFFTDTAAASADTAYYQVEGIDAFGRTSRRSAVVAAIMRDLEAPSPPTAKQATVAGDTIIVSWDAPPATDVAAFQVWRAQASAGPFERIGARLPARAREFRDPRRPARRLTWYRVTAIDGAGHESEPSALTMAEVRDIVAPSTPTGLVATADTGRITLTWSAVPAGDLLGYRVYRAQTDSGASVMLTSSPRRDLRVVDSIPSRADHPYFYRVTAVDSAFNESLRSTVVAVRPPDVTPPAEPRITSVRSGERALVVEWLANVEPDVVAYRFVYRAENEPRWIQAPRTVASPGRTGTITGLEAGRRYEVTVVAVDDAGNVSRPSPVLRGAPLRRAVPAPELKRATYEGANRSVRLEWNAGDPDVVELSVLRRDAGGTLRIIGSATIDRTTYLDRTARPGREYEYALRARYRSGDLIDSKVRRVATPELPQGVVPR